MSPESSGRQPTAPRLHFGAFTLDPARDELLRRGRPVPLAAQPASLLTLLVRRAADPGSPDLVTREEIRQHLWGDDVHVDYEQGIGTAVRQVRQALGDRAANPRFIETVPRRGFRFIAPVTAEAETGEPGGAVDAVRPGPPGPQQRPPWRFLAAALLLLLIVAALLLDGRTGARDGDPAVVPPPVRLAVLPFEDLSPDADADWLSRGLSDDLRAALSRRYGAALEVIAATSARRAVDESTDLDGVVRALEATYVVRGGVHLHGGDLRVSAVLLDARDGSQLWAGTYDRTVDDALAVQRELGQRIARALALSVIPDRQLAAPPAADVSPSAAHPRAYQAYLRGRHAMAAPQPDAERAIPRLRQAVEIDPTFAAAWMRLAEALYLTTPPGEDTTATRQALDHALTLDDASPQAHLLAAYLALFWDHDLAAARERFERALELHPNYAAAHHSFAGWFSMQGRHEEALDHVARALSLDPLSPAVNADVGWYHYFAGRPERAAAASRRTLELAPLYSPARRSLLLSLIAAGDLDGATEVARGEMAAGGSEALRPEVRDQELTALGAARAAGDPAEALRAYWRWRLAEWRAAAERRPRSLTRLAEVQMALGDRDAALDTLERAADERSGWRLPFLAVHPLFAPLHGDPRFVAAMEKILGDASPV